MSQRYTSMRRSSLVSFFKRSPLPRLLLLVVLILVISLTIFLALNKISSKQEVAPPGLLPGQQRWQNGVSSYLFGTNDTGEWSADNIETDPHHIIQPALKAAGFTLLRSFFNHTSFSTHREMTDAEIAARIRTTTNTGMNCLGVISSISLAPASQQPGYTYTDFEFAKHLVTLLDGRHGYQACDLWEIGNEPAMSVQRYVQAWNAYVPALRHINPRAKFIGPVVAQYYPAYISAFLQGAKASGILPDAVSWHRYPCWHVTDPATCLTRVPTFGQDIANAKELIQSILGKALPVGITEWSADPNISQRLGTDPVFMPQFVSGVLNQMIQAHLDFATQFDAQSYAAYGGLDMFDRNNGDQPRAFYMTFKNIIARYRSG